MCSEIRSTKTLSSSVRSIDIKEKMKNALNENIVFKIKRMVAKQTQSALCLKNQIKLFTLQISN